jgi:D-alanyl-D-alanine dipeptidase
MVTAQFIKAPVTELLFWAMYIPQFTVELENNPSREMLWACMTATGLINLYREWSC